MPGLVFEEVSVDETVDGPTGPVEGAIVGQELHQDGSFSDKTFAPGYGEFYSAHEGDVEALALAVPTDALQGPPPAELEALSAGADGTFTAVRARDWKAASAEVAALTGAWKAYRARGVPPRLATEMSRALEKLAKALETRDGAKAGTAAIDVARSTLDLELRYRPPAEIDRDLATLEWIRDRFAHALENVDITRIDAHLGELRTSLGDEDLGGAAATAERLRETLARVQPTS